MLYAMGFAHVDCFTCYQCLKFKTIKHRMQRDGELNNIFFTLMARGPDVDMSEITGKEHMEAQPAKKEGEGNKLDLEVGFEQT
ncbi:Signal recognition particle 9 kDa protein [Hibiscus syriacus]|uniref:Signal recognition particle 9 kDa protein n=1 Tax=Hibiscus syriacus TaxID=106335 RepID=A0A6A2YQV3_HIBSY|nr:Signal recognition particle 9 kDa protein [Hibiscus syriacus]